MGFAIAQARWDRKNGLAEDVVVNTFHFITPTPGAVTVSEAQSIGVKIAGFYDTTYAPQAVALRTFLSSVLSGRREIRVYDLEQPKPRVPVHTRVDTGIQTATSGLPSEVAFCLSYRATPVSGLPAARRRGRIYLGPLGANAALSADTADVRPAPQLINVALQGAVSSLMEDVGVGDWAVASQPQPGAITSLAPITQCWADNAFDTQHRRGTKATFKTFLPV